MPWQIDDPLISYFEASYHFGKAFHVKLVLSEIDFEIESIRIYRIQQLCLRLKIYLILNILEIC